MSKVFSRNELIKICEKQNISLGNLEEFTIPDGFDGINQCTFEGCKSLKKVNIPDSVTEIDFCAFRECRSLKEINIPDGMTEIGDYAFENCVSLEKINIPDGVTEIGAGVFKDCESLEKINIPDNVTKIEAHAFRNCISLKKINIPESVTKIGYEAFMGCESLKDINIPDSVTKIGMDVFIHCKSLKKIITNEEIFNQIKDNLSDNCIRIDPEHAVKNNNHRMTYDEFVECNNRNKQYIKEKGLVTFHIENPRNACRSGVITAVKHGVAVVDNPEALEQNWDDMTLLLDNSENTEKKSKHNGKLSFDEQVFPEISSEDIKKLESLKNSGYDKSAVEEYIMFDETTENQNDRSILD